MAFANTGCVKEQTIRGLLVECAKGQVEIQLQLQREFDRQTAKLQEKCTDTPNRPNVLDEIADSLTEISQSQHRTIEFIIQKINSKL